jgi:hypothetical protein
MTCFRLCLKRGISLILLIKYIFEAIPMAQGFIPFPIWQNNRRCGAHGGAGVHCRVCTSAPVVTRCARCCPHRQLRNKNQTNHGVRSTALWRLEAVGTIITYDRLYKYITANPICKFEARRWCICYAASSQTSKSSV